ncbi:MAG: AsmA-like C-terminal region-containing protein, partial [Planctomycetes bacterium]|nr:AsmA-like C-terminal region-containing protein [Planctomycetota bacterium]
ESLRVTIDRLLGGTAERPSAVGGIWRDLQPEAGATLGLAGICVSVAGTIDNPDPVERLQAGIELKDCALTYSGFALPLRGVSGRIGISRAGECSSIVLSGFRASAPAGTVELANLMFDAGDANGGGRFSITISGRGIPLDDNLRNAFPEELRGMYDALDPNARLKSWVDRPERAGSVNLDVTLTLEGARMEYDAKIEFVDADLELGVTFNDCSGLLACRGAMWDDAEGHRLANHIIYDGRVQFDLARWKGLTFTGVTAAVQYDNGRFILPNIRGEIHEGILEGSLMLDYSATEPKYEGNFTARRVSLGSIAQVLDGAYDPNAKDAMRGGLDAEINFHPLDKSGEIGKGRIDIGRIPLSVEELKRIHDLPKEEFDALAPEQRYGKPGALGRVPLFEGLYKALDVEEAGLFDEAHIIFRLMEDRMKIRQMELLSDVLSIAASGGINVDNDDRNPYAKNPSIFAADIESDTNYILYQPDDKGNELDFTLVPNFAPRLPSMPVAQTVFDAFKGVVAKIFVSGTFIKPEVGVGSRLRERTKDDWHDVDPDRSSNRPG